MGPPIPLKLQCAILRAAACPRGGPLHLRVGRGGLPACEALRAPGRAGGGRWGSGRRAAGRAAPGAVDCVGPGGRGLPAAAGRGPPCLRRRPQVFCWPTLCHLNWRTNVQNVTRMKSNE